MALRAVVSHLRETLSSEELRNKIEQAHELQYGRVEDKTKFLEVNGIISPHDKLTPESINDMVWKYKDELQKEAELSDLGDAGAFATYLENYINLHLGKQSDTDRSTEKGIDRRALTWSNALIKLQSRAMFMFNASTALASQQQ